MCVKNLKNFLNIFLLKDTDEAIGPVANDLKLMDQSKKQNEC